jgi:drug/metabolite transporter (DMT)-like permease
VTLVVVSATGFATLPVFGKLAYASGTEPFALLAWRFSIAAALMLVATAVGVLAGRVVWPSAKLTLGLLALGALLLTPEVILYFIGLQTVSAGLAETLLYLYPAWVVLIASIAFRQRPTRVTVVCVLGAVLGAAITVGSVSGGSLLGMALVTGASLLFATYVVVASRVLPRAGSLAGTALVLTGVAVVFVVLAIATDSRGPQGTQAWAGVLGMAVIGTVLAFGLLSAGLRHVSAPVAAVISTIEPVVAVVLGAIVLDERVSGTQVLGMALILVSVGVLLWFEARAEAAGRAPLVDPVALGE